MPDERPPLAPARATLALIFFALVALVAEFIPLSAQPGVTEQAPESVNGSIGDLIWRDLDNNGRVDLDEPGIGGVLVTAMPDINGDGAPDHDTVLADSTSDDSGNYLLTGLEPGSYVVVVPASNWAPGGPLSGCASSDPTAVDPTTGREDDDNGVVVPNLGVIAGPVTITPDRAVDSTIDFGCFTPEFDLALSIDGPGTTGFSERLEIEINVVNQGSHAAERISVSAYLPAGVALADDQWTPQPSDDGGAKAERVLELDTFHPGEVASVLLAVDVVAEGELRFAAEISEGVSIGRLPDGSSYLDIDSSPDGLDDDPVVDDELGDDGTFDEDDHDVALIRSIPPGHLSPSDAPPTDDGSDDADDGIGPADEPLHPTEPTDSPTTTTQPHAEPHDQPEQPIHGPIESRDPPPVTSRHTEPTDRSPDGHPTEAQDQPADEFDEPADDDDVVIIIVPLQNGERGEHG